MEKEKSHYIRRVEMITDFKYGGLNAIDFESINRTLKINWLKSLLNSNSFWFLSHRELFEKLGGMEFLLSCDFTVHGFTN